MAQTGHRIKWDHFDILVTGQSNIHCKIKETLLIGDLKPALNFFIFFYFLFIYFFFPTPFLFVDNWYTIQYYIEKKN